MTLSTKAWKRSAHIYDAIIRHPFNQELMQGTLSKDVFSYYIEQDSFYLQEFARCHAITASKIPLEYIRSFLKNADYIFIAEQEVVHQFFRKTFKFKETGLISPATIGYTSYLLKTCSIDSVEVAIAALLPCYWIYREVGLFIAKSAKQDNPYSRWIETYTSEEFNKSVNETIDIFNALADTSSEKTKIKMLEAFNKSSTWEWHFWNDSYKKRIFNDVTR